MPGGSVSSGSASGVSPLSGQRLFLLKFSTPDLNAWLLVSKSVGALNELTHGPYLTEVEILVEYDEVGILAAGE